MGEHRALASLIGSTALLKMTVMGASGLLGLFTTKLVISHFGTAAYAQYTLLVSFPQLLPFADLGITAVVMNAVAASSDPRRDPKVRDTLTTALRITLVSASVIGAVALILLLSGAWPVIMGNGAMPGGELTATICMCIFAAALPMAAAQRILIALGKSRTQQIAQAIVSPTMFGWVLLLVVLNLPLGGFVAIGSYLGMALVSVIAFAVIRKHLSPNLGQAIRNVPRRREVPGVEVMSVAGPQFVQMVAQPLALQSSRLLLSHQTTGTELAEYSLAVQLFGLISQGIIAGGLALWPVFARDRAIGKVRSPMPISGIFGGVSLLLGLAAALIAPWLVHFVSAGKLDLSSAVLACFVGLVVVNAVKYPLDMYMTDARGLRAQLIPVLMLLPVNVGLTWLLIPLLGAAGPILATAVSVLLCQLLPYSVWIRRDLRRRREYPEGASV